MKIKKAIEILSALVQGLDPNTGSELTSDSVLQHAEVLRAMLAAINCLKQQLLRDARRATLPGRIGQPWDADEERRLIELFEAGTALADIATEVDRSIRAVEARLERLGLLTPDQRQTRSSFT